MIKKCKFCGEEFKTMPCRIKKGNGIYCSLKCFGKDIEKKLYKNCLICNKKFKIKFAQCKNGRGKYCSRDCYWQSLKGKPQSKEAKEKNRKKQLGKIVTTETRIKLSKIHKGKTGG